MRALFRLVVVLMVLAVGAQIALAVAVWMDADGVIARAGQAGAFRQSGDQHLTTAERTIAIDEFSSTWGVSAFPCRTFSIFWNDLTTPDAINPGMPVSQRLSTTLLDYHGATSMRWQLRRVIVACQLEQRFNDTQMLRAWLANSHFSGSAGIDGLAQSVFAKPSSALNADEAAKLAALLRSPGLRTQPDRWTQQAHVVSERVAAWRR